MSYKSRTIAIMILLCCVLLLNSGCHAPLATDVPISSRIVLDKFTITLTSQHCIYYQSDMDKSAPLAITAMIEYTGDDYPVDVWHGLPYFQISLVSVKGEPWGGDTIYNADAHYSEFSHGQVEKTKFTGKEEYELYGAPTKGMYTVVAEIGFWSEKAQLAYTSCVLEVPIEIA